MLLCRGLHVPESHGHGVHLQRALKRRQATNLHEKLHVGLYSAFMLCIYTDLKVELLCHQNTRLASVVPLVRMQQKAAQGTLCWGPPRGTGEDKQIFVENRF